MSEDIFVVGNKITTNRTNCLEVIASNSYQVACRDLLNDDLIVFDKTEHKFEIADIKLILEVSLKEILDDQNLSDNIKREISNQMGLRINSWL